MDLAGVCVLELAGDEGYKDEPVLLGTALDAPAPLLDLNFFSEGGGDADGEGERETAEAASNSSAAATTQCQCSFHDLVHGTMRCSSLMARSSASSKTNSSESESSLMLFLGLRPNQN